jgi:hypothetical protein
VTDCTPAQAQTHTHFFARASLPRPGEQGYYIKKADLLLLANANLYCQTAFKVDKQGGVTITWGNFAGGADEAFEFVELATLEIPDRKAIDLD